MRQLKEAQKELAEVLATGKDAVKTLTEVAENRRNEPLARAIAASVLTLMCETKAENLRKEISSITSFTPKGREAARR